MDFRYPPEAEAFRHEFRAWLDANLPDELRGRGTPRFERRRTRGPRAASRLEPPLADARYAAIAWPEEWGGRGAGVMDQVVYAEEMHRAQRARHAESDRHSEHRPGDHRARHRRAEANACCPACCAATTSGVRGSPSPNAGSDLASLRTSAVRDGDGWIINGQKTWNTFGHLANWCELLVRTDPNVPKHQGITCLLVDMTLPGVEVRPLVTITGDAGVQRDLLHRCAGARRECSLGPVNDGWRVAMTTLAYERGTVAKLHTGTRAKIARLIDDARRTPLGDGRMASDDPVVRQKLAAAYLDGELLKLISDRALSAELHGRRDGP